ncbi:hypothetical protein VIBR0546_02740 [Vibrio brasiliensis LMG 20546]|uniref:Uncharacterized protein n=1 Tax=Vibrio brasiliensis LMG 20546 TaxID=945543 RepID=E8LYC7_9VIBR|nr:hypothetical protein VIBR0546_02740 [Vibrio brasiliensis LMG 20546]
MSGIELSKIKSELERLDNQQLKNIRHEVDKLLNEKEKSGELLSEEEIEFIRGIYKK